MDAMQTTVDGGFIIPAGFTKTLLGEIDAHGSIGSGCGKFQEYVEPFPQDIGLLASISGDYPWCGNWILKCGGRYEMEIVDGILNLGGEKLQADDITKIEIRCDKVRDFDAEYTSDGEDACWKPGPFITTTVRMKGGQTIIETKDNKEYR